MTADPQDPADPANARDPRAASRDGAAETDSESPTIDGRVDVRASAEGYRPPTGGGDEASPATLLELGAGSGDDATGDQAWPATKRPSSELMETVEAPRAGMATRTSPLREVGGFTALPPGTRTGPEAVTMRVKRLHGIETSAVVLPESPAATKRQSRPRSKPPSSVPGDAAEGAAGDDAAGDRTAEVTSVRYLVGEEIARGGMGAIIDAEDIDVGRRVAMKVLLPQHRDRRAAVVRFLKEAQITGQLEHPNIVPMYDIGIAGSAGDRLYYTMKYVRGRTLADVLYTLRAGEQEYEERYPLRRLLGGFCQLCNAVAFAHSRGVIHRDLKPENVMLGDFGEILLMDWGLAKVVPPSAPTAEEDEPASRVVTELRQSARYVKTVVVEDAAADAGTSDVPSAAPPATIVAEGQAATAPVRERAPSPTEVVVDDDDALRETIAASAVVAATRPGLRDTDRASSEGGPVDVDLTRDGMVIGTPSYMAPEQALGDASRIGPRTDVYALGAILYEILSLYPPYDGATAVEILAKTVSPTHKPTPPEEKNPQRKVPQALTQICLRALEPDEADRYQSAEDLRDAVQSWMDGRFTWVAPDRPVRKVVRACTLAALVLGPAVAVAEFLTPDFSVWSLFDLRALVLLLLFTSGIVWLRFGPTMSAQAFRSGLGELKLDRKNLCRYAAFWKYTSEARCHLAAAGISVMLLTTGALLIAAGELGRAPPSLLDTLLATALYAQLAYFLFFVQQTRLERSLQWVDRHARGSKFQNWVLVSFIGMTWLAVAAVVRAQAAVAEQPIGVMVEPYLQFMLGDPLGALFPWTAITAVAVPILVARTFFPFRDYLGAAKLWWRNKKATSSLERRNLRYAAAVLKTYGGLTLMVCTLYCVIGYYLELQGLLRSGFTNDPNADLTLLAAVVHRSVAPIAYGAMIWLATSVFLPRRLLALAGERGEDATGFRAMVKAGLTDVMGPWARRRKLVGWSLILLAFVASVIWIYAVDLASALT